mgnify:CR=1 FL=1
MGRKAKFSKEVKITACEKYKNGKGSFVSIANEVGCAVEVLRKWYKEKLIPSNVYKMTSRDVKSYMEQKLCGISVLTLSEHRTVKQSTIEEFTSIYYQFFLYFLRKTLLFLHFLGNIRCLHF